MLVVAEVDKIGMRQLFQAYLPARWLFGAAMRQLFSERYWGTSLTTAGEGRSNMIVGKGGVTKF